jgi:hypothetical protein
MQNDYDLQNLEDFKINPHVWLQTLLAIAGDKQKKKDVIHTVSQQSGMSPEKVEILIHKAINVLITDTRSN